MKRPFELVAEIQEKDAEIERLNKGWTQEAELAARCHRTYEITMQEKDNLITELCDALEWESDKSPQFVKSLIQRAREATKNG